MSRWPILFLLALACLNVLWRSHRTRALLELCSEWQELASLVHLRGTIWEDSAGRVKLSPTEVFRRGRWEDLPAIVGLPDSPYSLPNSGPNSGPSPEFGQGVWITARPVCRYPLQNPSVIEDGLGGLLPPRVWLRPPLHLAEDPGAPSNIAMTFRTEIEAWLVSLFENFPGVSGFERAIWMGDTRGLSPELMTFYREGGLLAILALSGQHLAGLIMCVSYLQWIPFALMRRFLPGWTDRILFPWRRALPSICALVLWVSSGGSPPMLRTLAMAIAMGLLKWRGLHGVGFQILCSSTALFLIWDVRQAASISLFLSIAATALTLIVFSEARLWPRIRIYIFTSVSIPILMVPVTSFFFGRVSVFAPLYQTLLGWIWDLFLIPLGFFLPLALALVPPALRPILLKYLELGWDGWLRLHESLERIVGNNYMVTVRPKWHEWILVECILIGVLMRVTRNNTPFNK
jgi:hypothetical protein